MGPIYQATTINELEGLINSAGSAGATVQFAVYKPDGTNGTPGTLVAATSATAIVATATGITSGGTFTAVSLPAAGYWWCAGTNDDGVVLFSLYNASTLPNQAVAALGSATLATVLGAGNTKIGIQCTSCTGYTAGSAWPSSLAGSTWLDTGTSGNRRAPTLRFKVQ